MFPGAFDDAGFLPPGRRGRGVLGRLADPVLLGDEEALAGAWGAQVVLDHLLAREERRMTPGAQIVTEFFHIGQGVLRQMLRGEDTLIASQSLVPRK